jgi:hypothetical protein
MTYSRGCDPLARRGAALVLFSLVLNLQCLHNTFGAPGPWVYSPGRLFDTEGQPEVHSMHVSQKAGMMPGCVEFDASSISISSVFM